MGFRVARPPKNRPVHQVHTARSAEVGKSGSAVSGTSPPSRADGSDPAGSNKPEPQAAPSRKRKPSPGRFLKIKPNSKQTKQSPTSQSTESLSPRNFWHFDCGAGSDARSKQGSVTGDDELRLDREDFAKDDRLCCSLLSQVSEYGGSDFRLSVIVDSQSTPSVRSSRWCLAFRISRKVADACAKGYIGLEQADNANSHSFHSR